MSEGLMKMWIAFGAIAFMFFSVFFIYVSRFKLKRRFLKGLTATFAYLFMVIAGLIIMLVVFSGPVQK
ncbi:DUF2768 domain-containing protein [Priestia filamentosa]|uniref:Uncharacterized protein n=1 Tax=Priestia filamentosa TaxID=1402861 RepID=A0A1X7D309_9BACI|nr:DUF2768 domain-containing protein [Priestia filamentosa]AKO93975.1 hypothetical protein BEH_18910 [Priestia filamentosa]MDT3764221.1 DUF2768 domain-containing protein [Priestia filamentosa]OXS71309.1 hypothetical protein B1B01_03070 [Priestia filamentosa]RJS66950.1 DUF2768 domain-containing protein [Priestia filamentosa]WCM14849.1 DUF2768 domain-containing protein [Priestia filamentosa]